jgi:DsbC/DsbD-like thiol-disulfide interchange protein
VLLLAEITPPAVLAEKEVSLKTKAVWMCCARESDCRPGVADLELTLPVSANAANPDPAWSKAFADARETLPAADRSWTFTAVRSGGKITLTASPASPDAGTPDSSHLPLFFSDNHLICSNEPQIWQRTNKGFEGILTVAELAPKDVQALTGVIRLETGWRKDGKAPFIELNVPLTGAIGRNER